MTPTTVNIASHLTEMATRFPQKSALVMSRGRDSSGKRRYRHVSFQELDQESDRYAHGLTAIGIKRGMRTALLVPPGDDFFALVFALFKIGAVMVLIDPGMGLRRMLQCLGEVKPEAFIGVPAAMALKTLTRSIPSVKIQVTVSGHRLRFWRGRNLSSLREKTWRPFPTARTDRRDPAAVLFTTGSTGLAKGALYEHGMFDAQVRALQQQYGIGTDEIDLPTFPLFALFDPALGMTAVIPEMDFRKPASVDPLNILEPIRDLGVTHLFGSPALLNRVGAFGAAAGVKLPSVRRVISAGAPVPPPVLEKFASMLSQGCEIHTPYGATEALPVATIGSSEILGQTRFQTEQGAGTCVGRPAVGIEIRIIPISDAPIAEWTASMDLPAGEIGEIAVRGPVVTRQYCERDEATLLAKIPDGEAVWHRMGDLGRFDREGRLWFLGRKSHRVVTVEGTHFTDPCEGIINTHPDVLRSALVGVGRAPNQRAMMLVELKPGKRRAARDLQRELLELASKHAVTSGIDEFHVHPRFPVDIRHNSKIFREKLAHWAEKRVGRA